MLIGQTSPFGALLMHTLLAVFGTLAEWDAAVAKGAGSAERPAARGPSKRHRGSHADDSFRSGIPG
jgi:hypothetical protein